MKRNKKENNKIIRFMNQYEFINWEKKGSNIIVSRDMILETDGSLFDVTFKDVLIEDSSYVVIKKYTGNKIGRNLISNLSIEELKKVLPKPLRKRTSNLAKVKELEKKVFTCHEELEKEISKLNVQFRYVFETEYRKVPSCKRMLPFFDISDCDAEEIQRFEKSNIISKRYYDIKKIKKVLKEFKNLKIKTFSVSVRKSVDLTKATLIINSKDTFIVKLC